MSLFQRFKSLSSSGNQSQANNELMEHDFSYDNSFQRALRDKIRDRNASRKVVRLDTELQQSRLDRVKALLGRNESDKILLIRRHKHLIRPLENNERNLHRPFSNGTITRFILLGCFFTGYAYAKLQQDEVLRRNFYCRYANFITFFDTWSPILEDSMLRMIIWC